MECRVCKSSNLYEFCSLGDQPLANSFIRKDDRAKKEPKFHLILNYCARCGMVQLNDVVPPKLMFENYLYIPSASQTRIKHFNELSEMLIRSLHATEDDLVVDIGSNDGSLLEQFMKFGVRILGVDPSVNLAKIAELKGITTINDFFNRKIAGKIAKKYGMAKIVTATNVFAHVDDIHEFVKGIETLLADDGWFVIEFPYLVDFIENCEFDTVYHEHLSYFAVRPLLTLFENTTLEIFSIKKMGLDGGSIRVFVRKKSKGATQYHEINKLVEKELSLKLNTREPYRRFAKDVLERKRTFKKLLKTLRGKKNKIVGYGAPAKGNTFLNYCNVSADDIAYVVDSTPYKQGLFLPGSHIPIYHENKIYSDTPDYIILLAWNFADEIMNKNASLRKKGVKFILPHEDFRIA